MSSELFVSNLDDDVFGSLMIEMNVHCNLRFVTYDANGHDSSSFNIPPNEEGRKDVKNIISALQSWLEVSGDCIIP